MFHAWQSGKRYTLKNCIRYYIQEVQHQGPGDMGSGRNSAVGVMHAPAYIVTFTDNAESTLSGAYNTRKSHL
jgi:hypothetical protein